MRLQSVDTSPDIEKMQLELLRQAGTARRLALLRGQTASIRKLSLTGLRQLHPQLPETELRLLFVRHLYGDMLADGARELLFALNKTLDKNMHDDVFAAIAPVAAAFEKLGITYLIGGSVASSLLGIPRSTVDGDLVADVGFAQIAALVSELQTEFYVAQNVIEEAVTRRSSFTVLHLGTLTKVDVFIVKDSPFERAAFERRQSTQVEVAGVMYNLYFSSAEDIILHKLVWYEAGNRISERQWLDILGVMKVRGAELDRSYLTDWAEKLSLSELLSQALVDAGLDPW
jgi:hypothetical protein